MDITIKITGEAGQGLQTVGQLLGKYFTRRGYYVFCNQDNESRIRGGHNFFQVRVATDPVSAVADRVNVLVPLDRAGIDLHLDEVVPEGLVLLDEGMVDHPRRDGRFLFLPLNELAREKGGSLIFVNVAATAAVLAQLGQAMEPLAGLLRETFPVDAGEKNIQVASSTYELALRGRRPITMEAPPPIAVPRMFINGHEALALGALAAGCKFIAAYPMSPSTPIITYLYQMAEKFGLVVEQAEDEIAAMNMAVGAAYTGVRAMTATSGGGFSLMVEGLGLAGMTETPVVVVNAQRPGPATGLPTRTEQGDLEFVIHAAQGEFPRFVLAPRTIPEAFYLTIRAFNLAEKFQVPAVILTDQHLGEAYISAERFDLSRVVVERYLLTTPLPAGERYRRYRFAESGLSPRAMPGLPGMAVTLDSDEHDEDGRIIEDAVSRRRMVEKRLGKWPAMAAALEPPEITGDIDARWVLVGWGSTHGALAEACALLRQRGEKVQMRCLVDLWPLRNDVLADIPAGARLVAVEGNYTGQLARLLAVETGRRADYRINRYDGRPFTPGYILEHFAVFE
ncbi:2-oxoacid:acceptor oxidoreductase subunit alpha [Moorella sp. Hama-1]|uniref:2-oxoacid:acceptor oxidoreductase subunit alpha n=1 Tax=Moorella sp. Hama-1 TaxID=2138101 RepID=UPI00137B43A5|nr:2-oxoacid:acceptor oxidoreductase subunit alpha [Moorella sp. Hama-1]BCV22067.1 2-oxoacid:ferredoxin oxidoreductase subunit alpha [Moorella sp. Hama-1]